MSGRDLDRYSRQIMLEEIGYNGQLDIRRARVCIVGSGGLGNPIASRLVAMGVGTVRLVDRDVIELSNLHRQTLFDEGDVGQVKVEAAAAHLRKMNSGVLIEPLAVSVNMYNAPDVVDGCDVVIDALDSVSARYALNRACVKKGIPFVTGAAVGTSGQVFTVLPGRTACYHCMFPELDEDSMPTCSIEGVHPPVLSIVAAIEVAEAVKIMLKKSPNLSERILHVDIENLDFSFTRTFRAEECPVCGSGREREAPRQEMIIEELCGRNRGRRTFSLTPTQSADLDVERVTRIAREKGFTVDNQGDLGLSVRTTDLAVSFMKKCSAVVVGPRDEDEALHLYCSLLGRPPLVKSR
ncbi:Sulfur carrier protein ThiS adenylyltransferase [Geodia barretti]|uniref:Sulfur carrier protein ThiS adenylyltransferase n=1 Tax=Geodia barretti TaxID=519541 RepID=A0AA35SGU9_GEOBA|nr:Sulfur carrier protein ThiS adenylyltransferase [Geodia barretti]